MKNMKKISNLLCLVLVAVLFVFTGISSTKAAPQTITISRTGVSPKYIDAYDFYNLKFDDDTVVYCYSGPGNWPTDGLTYTLDGEASAAIKYILENGPRTSDNSQVARYVTQGAIWWYRAENGEISALSTEFVETGAESETGIRDLIKNLVRDARNNTSTSNKKAYIFKSSGYQDVVALYAPDPEPTPDPEPEEVCVEYEIVGNVRPDPAKTDPTPGKECYNKGTEYDQKKELKTRQSNCKFNGWYTNSNLTGRWTNGTALNNNLKLYGAWECGTPVIVPATAANTPLIILGVGLTAIAIGAGVYIYRDKKINSNK